MIAMDWEAVFWALALLVCICALGVATEVFVVLLGKWSDDE